MSAPATLPDFANAAQSLVDIWDIEHEEAEQDDREAAPAFAIDSEDRANWLLRKLGNLAAERARVKAQADAIMAELKREEERLHQRFDAELQAFTRQALAGKKSRTLKLLQGTVSLRTVAASMRVADTEAAFEHARTCLPDLIETKQALKVADYGKLARETGEMLPGIEVTPEHETMSIRFSGNGEETR